MEIKKKLYPLVKQYKYPLILLCVLLLLFIGTWSFFKTDSQTLMAGEQISSLIEKVRNFYQRKPNAWGLNTYSAIQNKIVPQAMLNGRQIKNSFNKDVLLGADILGNTVMPGSKTFAVVYKNLNKKECLALALFPFSDKTLLSIDSINIINTETHSFNWGDENGLPISEKAAEKSCKEVNDILWNIYL